MQYLKNTYILFEKDQSDVILKYNDGLILSIY